jgi:bifunctional DNA-binding transcriptional regulator/antitoxin component of YhaV-PrlF toxin-antitoxin module
MAITMTKVRVSSKGDLTIPPEIVQKVGLQPGEEATLSLLDEGLAISKVSRITDADSALKRLVASQVIRLSNLGDTLKGNIIPDLTLEHIHRAFSGLNLPIEDIIREEREKYEP